MPALLCAGFFVITKGENMQKVSYMGDGATTEFTFNFPYFENTDVVVEKNGATATGYNIVGNSAGLDADIPYTGGKVVFDTAPGALDNITIARSLPLTRQYDYQPTVKIEPTTLNQDMNYLMEVLKDLNDELDDLRAQYHDIADKESTTTLLARISAIHDEIVAVSAQITALGDVSQIRSDITALRDASNLTTTGKATIVNLAMPGSTYDELTVGASGTAYTATADGYVSVHATAVGAANTYVELVSDTCPEFGCSQQAAFNGVMRLCMPVTKNSTYRLWYNGPHFEQFRFYYAIGEITE